MKVQKVQNIIGMQAGDAVKDCNIMVDFGQFRPNITFVVSEGCEINPLKNVKVSVGGVIESSPFINLNTTAEVCGIFGEYWNTSVGAHFRPTSLKEARHVLIEVSWRRSALFCRQNEPKRGVEILGNGDKILYHRKTPRDESGVMRDYIIIPKYFMKLWSYTAKAVVLRGVKFGAQDVKTGRTEVKSYRGAFPETKKGVVRAETYKEALELATKQIGQLTFSSTAYKDLVVSVNPVEE